MASTKTTSMTSPPSPIELPGGVATTTTKDQTKTTPKKTNKKPSNKAGSSKGGKTTSTPTTGTAPVATDVNTAVKKFYPQWSYMLDNEELFGSDLIAVLTQASAEDWSDERTASAIYQTKYWQNTVQTAKNFDAYSEADKQTAIEKTKTELKSYTDISTIDDASLTTFARDMARRGITGEALRPLAYKFIFDQGAATKAANEALYSANASGIRQTASNYGQTLDDSTLETLLSNGETADTMQRKYVVKLKAQYPQLAAQLDAGLNFRDITDDYRRVAAQTLETSYDSIDFMDPKYMEAIAQPDGKGNYRQLSLGEWQQKLRTDDRYGFYKTKTAIQDAQMLASSISKTFGRVI